MHASFISWLSLGNETIEVMDDIKHQSQLQRVAITATGISLQLIV